MQCWSGCCGRCTASRRLCSCWTRMPAGVATTSIPVPQRARGNGKRASRDYWKRHRVGTGGVRRADAIDRPLPRLAGDRARPAATRRPLACCELHPEDAASLRRHFVGDPPGRGASSGCVGGARRPAASEGAARPRPDRPAVRGPARVRPTGARPRHRLAALPHRRVRRLVSDQAARARCASS